MSIYISTLSSLSHRFSRLQEYILNGFLPREAAFGAEGGRQGGKAGKTFIQGGGKGKKHVRNAS